MFGGSDGDAMQVDIKQEIKTEPTSSNEQTSPPAAVDAKPEPDQKPEDQEEDEDDEEDELEIVLNTDAVGKMEPQTGPIQLNPPSVSGQSGAGFQAKPNYFRQPMMIQQGNKYTKATTATPQGRPGQQQGPTTLQIQTFMSSNNSGPSSLVPILGHSAVKKMQMELDIDSIEDKQWRKPGADLSDYFNYGFTEDTWRLYCQKQVSMRQESSQLATQVPKTSAPAGAAPAPVQPGPAPVQPGMAPLQVVTKQPMPQQMPQPPISRPAPVAQAAPVAPTRPLSFQPAGAPTAPRPRPRDQDDSVVQIMGGDDAAVPTPAPAASNAPSKAAGAAASSAPPSKPRDDRDDRRRDDDRDRRSRDRSDSRDRSRRSRSRSRSRDRHDSSRSRGASSSSTSGGAASSSSSSRRKRSRSRSPPRGDEKRRRRE